MVTENTIGNYIFFISISMIIVASIASFSMLGGFSLTGAAVFESKNYVDSKGLDRSPVNNIIGSIVVGILFFAGILCVSHISVGVYGLYLAKPAEKRLYAQLVERRQKSNRLAQYVEECIKHGLSRDEITSRCLKVGWKHEHVSEAFRRN